MTLTSTPLDWKVSKILIQIVTHSHQTTALLLATGDTTVDNVLHVTLQTFAKVLEHGRTTREYNVLVQASTSVNRRSLDDVVDNLWKGRQEVGRVDFGIEEDFGGKEALVTNVKVVFLPRQSGVPRS